MNEWVSLRTCTDFSFNAAKNYLGSTPGTKNGICEPSSNSDWSNLHLFHSKAIKRILFSLDRIIAIGSLLTL